MPPPTDRAAFFGGPRHDFRRRITHGNRPIGRRDGRATFFRSTTLLYDVMKLVMTYEISEVKIRTAAAFKSSKTGYLA